jgi:hypothetical protein
VVYIAAFMTIRGPALSDSAETTRNAKREKFVRLAEARTRNAIRAIRIIGKLGNRNAYEYSDADIRRIASALGKEIEAMKMRMSQTRGPETVDFEL